ncbi:MAG: SRPBCC family protein [Armatimonadetes bacterium]|nr:SRPBCC family protein [Armatimonadota bacterium]
MPTVTSEIIIDAPIDRVYQIARDIERFPEFMDDVDEVEILEQTEERQVSRWAAAVKEFNRQIKWVEEDFWSAEDYSCEFHMLEGDFSEYSGTWKFEPAGEGTKATLVVNYAYNVPLIGALIQSVLKKKTQHNCDSMLAAIKAEAEKG